MPHGNISAALSETDVTDIKAAIKLIESKMPFLIALDIEEKKSLFKQGPKSVDFVDDAMNATKNFPELLPPALDKPEFLRDGSLFKVLADISQPLLALAAKLEDTYMAIGAEAMGTALQVYAYVQTAAPKVPGVKPLADKMQERFKRQSRMSKKAAAQ